MDFLLLSIALLPLFLAGFGVSQLLASDRQKTGAELFGLSFLFGSAIVSLSSFLLGFLVSGATLRWSVAALCVAIGVIGFRQRGLPNRYELLPKSVAGKCLLALGLAQITIVVWLSFQRVLGWDGLFNFETKARLAFLNGGVLPLDFFSDPSRSWTLQSYPLMLPLTESWLYLWLGRADQQLVKILFPLFFASALGLLSGGNRLLGLGSWQRFVAPLLVFIAPGLLIGDGSASSGYADFPLAVVYLAAAISLLNFWQSGDRAALQLAGAVAACGCWLKQEGAILWFCLMAIAAIGLWLKQSSRSQWLELGKSALPGLLIVVGWQWFVREVGLPEIKQFSPISVASLRGNLWRLPVIAESVLAQLGNWRSWGIFWLIAAAAIARIVWQRKIKDFALMPLFVLLPLGLYSGVYVFSLWPSFVAHLESSFPRLLIHLSLVAALIVGAAAASFRKLPTVGLLLIGSLFFSSCQPLSNANQRLANLAAGQPLARSAGGRFATSDTYLRSLEIETPSERVLAVMAKLPETDAILFASASRTPEIELTYRVIVSLGWPREVGALHCGSSPELLFQPRREKPIRWLLFYRIAPPAELKPVAEIGQHLKLVAAEEGKEPAAYCPQPSISGR